MTKEIYNILDRFTGEVRFAAEIECAPDALPSVKLGLAVKVAVKARANLARADLARADLAGAKGLSDDQLRPFRADLWMTLTMLRAEVPALVMALREGRVDGSQYEGACACLVGTLANAGSYTYRDVEHNANNPAERWFAMIRKGDKPGDETAGGFAASKALQWTLEWCALNAVQVPAEVVGAQ